jgi:hypothetical protein
MRPFRLFVKYEKLVKYEMKASVPAWLWGSVIYGLGVAVGVGTTWAYHKKKGKKIKE